jgi:nucleotide-binding universal stress UspA family protein
MYQFKRILVALDQSDNDKILFQFVSHICSKIEIDKVYFIHVTKTLEWPPEIIEKYPDCLAPLDENIQHMIQEQISTNLAKDLIPDSEILVLDGNPEEVLLKEVNIKEIDLLVMGKKPIDHGTGRTARRMANLAQCSVALISNSFQKALNTEFAMMVSVDFNESSLNATKTAENIRSANDAKMVLHHVYRVPSGYHYSGKSFDEFAEIMKKNSEDKMLKLVNDAQLDTDKYKQLYTLDTKNNIAKNISETAENEKVHLIVVGSKGRTKSASIFLGSTAEQLVTNTDLNILIIKDKKSNLDLLSYLTDI